MVDSNGATTKPEQRDIRENDMPAADDRRVLLKKLGRFGAYTAPAMIAILTPATQAGAVSSQNY